VTSPLQTHPCQCDAEAAPLKFESVPSPFPPRKRERSTTDPVAQPAAIHAVKLEPGVWPVWPVGITTPIMCTLVTRGAAQSQLSTGESPAALAWDGSGGGEVAVALCDQRRVLLLPVDRCTTAWTASSTTSSTWSAPPPPGRLYARELTHAADDDHGRGFFDVAYGVRGPYAVLAAGADGAVRLWDRRAASEPRAVMESCSAGRGGRGAARLLSLQLSADEQVMLPTYLVLN
jgi:hypothetical protein